MRIKDEILCFAHLRWCHNGWASNILIVVDTTQNIGCPRIKIPSKMGKTKNFIFYSLIKHFYCFQVHVLFLCTWKQLNCLIRCSVQNIWDNICHFMLNISLNICKVCWVCWNYKAGGIVHLKPPTFCYVFFFLNISSFSSTCTCVAAQWGFDHLYYWIDH